MMLYSDQKKNDVPIGGKWYCDAAMMQAEYNKGPSQFMLALNTPNCYGLYPNARTFTYKLCDSKPINQRAYEIIPPNTPCKAYADLVFNSQADLDEILAHYKHKAMCGYGIDPLFEISDLSDCSARIIISNMPLANNHDGQMKDFFTSTDKLFSINQDIYSPAYHRQISITDQQDPDHIARFLVTNSVVPVVGNDKYLVNDMLKYHYKFGEYSIDNTIEFKQAPGNAELTENHANFVQSQFDHEPLKLDPVLQADISANLNAAQEKFQFAGDPLGISDPPSDYEDIFSGIPSGQHNSLLLHAICQLNVLAMTGMEMYSMLAALAIVSANNVCFAPDVLFALMIAFRQQESCLTMAFFTFMIFRSVKFSGMLKMAGDPKQVICWLIKRDERFNISISTLHKQLDGLLPGLKKRNRDVVQDILIKIWLVYGRNRPNFERLCLSSFRKYCKDRHHHDCNEEVMENSWKRRIENEFDGIFQFTKLYMGLDPLQELQQMCLEDVLDSIGAGVPQTNTTEPIKADLIYSHKSVRPLPTIHRVMVLVAQCGMGKTNAMHKWLREAAPDFVIFITHRKMLTRDAQKRMPQFGDVPWVAYDEVEGPLYLSHHKFIIVQLESLGRLNLEGCTNVTVVMDEFCSLCKQMESHCGDRSRTQINFIGLCETATHVLAMDGHMDQRRIDVLNRYCKSNAHVIQNTYKRKFEQQHHVCFTRDEGKAIAYIIDLLRRGEKVHVPCFSKEIVDMVVQAVKTEFGDSKSVKSYTRDNRWNPANDIDTELSNADLFIHTCTIDCGISYERDHFKYCVALLDPEIGIDYEVAAQMMARSRPTIQFLVCVRRPKKLHEYQSTDLQDILDGLKRDYVAQSNAFYFGARVIFGVIPDLVATCCPYLLMHVTNIAVARQASNNFIFELAMLLFNEGASISQMWFDEDMKDMKKELKQAKTAITDASSEYLCAQYQGTTIEMFEAWTPAKRAVYVSKHVRDGYNRLNNLQSHGPNHTAALIRLEELYIHGCGAVQACANSNRFNVNLIAMADLDIGVREGHYDLLAYKTACAILCMYTGWNDPYQATSILQSTIQQNLECSLVNKIWLVSDRVTNEIFTLQTRWINISPAMHTPSHVIHRTSMVSFKQAMTILNQILKFMYFMVLVKGEQVDPVYIMDVDNYFSQEAQQDNPPLKQWNQFPGQIKDQDVFRVGTHMNNPTIAVTTPYMPARNRMTAYNRHDRPIQAEDSTMEESNVKTLTAEDKRKAKEKIKRQQRKEKIAIEKQEKETVLVRKQYATTIDRFTTEDMREKYRMAKKKQRQQMMERKKKLQEKLDVQAKNASGLQSDRT